MGRKGCRPGETARAHESKTGRVSMSRRSLNSWLLAATLLTGMAAPSLAQQLPNATPTNTAVKDFKPVTADMLLKPDPADWLMWRRTYDGWGYSPLDPNKKGKNKKPQVGRRRAA